VASGAKNPLGLAALLVRPDGFVAWACDAQPSHDELRLAAMRWFGSPHPVAR
jgi:pentachlorophenol monooxygenase